jgi:hypothetical protein
MNSLKKSRWLPLQIALLFAFFAPVLIVSGSIIAISLIFISSEHGISSLVRTIPDDPPSYFSIGLCIVFLGWFLALLYAAWKKHEHLVFWCVFLLYALSLLTAFLTYMPLLVAFFSLMIGGIPAFCTGLVLAYKQYNNKETKAVTAYLQAMFFGALFSIIASFVIFAISDGFFNKELFMRGEHVFMAFVGAYAAIVMLYFVRNFNDAIAWLRTLRQKKSSNLDDL